jgi:thiol-disulfide isomerase/thioredoxin
MATRKFRKSRSRKLRPRKTVRGKTARRHRVSTAGKILPPLDVRLNKHLKEFEKRIKQGDLSIILVWAPWCPHCHTMMPHFDAAAKSPSRSIQAIKVEDKMLPAVNQVLTGSINKSAKPLNVEGYPSIIVVDKKGNKVTDIEPVRDTASMTNLMNNAGSLAKQAGLNKPNEDPMSVVNSLKNSLKAPENKNKNKKLLANLGFENGGLVSGNSPKNIDMGEEELKGSLAAVNVNKNKNKNEKNIKLKSIPANQLENAGEIPNEKPLNALEESIAPSPINMFNSNEPSKPSASPKKLSADAKEAEEVTSMVAPLTPPNNIEDMESISNSLTPEQKISGGGRGGSLYSSLARTAYTLAPAASLLATAALVMKGRRRENKTRKHSKKNRKTHRRRR